MKLRIIFLTLLPTLLYAQSGLDELVNPKDLIPDIVIDLRYSTPNHSFLNIPNEGNILLPKFYTCNEGLVILKLANALKLAQDHLRTITTHNNKEYPNRYEVCIFECLPIEGECFIVILNKFDEQINTKYHRSSKGKICHECTNVFCNTPYFYLVGKES